jgi:alpha-galactosidase
MTVQPFAYDEKKRQFTLSTVHNDYIFYVNQYGILIHLYFGARQSHYDFSSLLKPDVWNDYSAFKDGVETRIPGDGFVYEKALYECASEGRLDPRGAFAELRDGKGGERVTDFRYESYEISPQIPSISSLPIPRLATDSFTLIVHLRDELHRAKLDLVYTLYPRLDLLARKALLFNEGTRNLLVHKLSSVELDLPQADYDVISFGGGYCHEFTMERSHLSQGRHLLRSEVGASSHQLNPSAILCSPDADEDKGLVLGVVLAYSGDYEIALNKDEFAQCRMQAGVLSDNFDALLPPAQALETPEAYLGLFKGFAKMSDAFHRFNRRYVMPLNAPALSKAVLLNSWEAYYFSFDTQKVLSAIEKAHAWGLGLFVLDDGWFGQRDNDRCSLGDWQVNERKIDLGKVVERCHQLGMGFGLWFEPEMVSYDSDLYRAHPDWADIDPAIGSYSLHRHQLVLDLSREEVYQMLKQRLFSLIKGYHLDYLKWDYNRDASEGIFGNAHVYRRYLNLYRLLDEIKAAFPLLQIETCAGGGGRFDEGMMAFSSRIWASDNQGAADRSFIDYGASFFYPPEAISAHVNLSANQGEDEAKKAVMMFGSFGYELDPAQADPAQVRAGVDFYRNYHSIVEEGHYFRLLSPYQDGALALESVLVSSKRALLCFYPLTKKRKTGRIFPRHLQPEGLYEISSNKRRYRGKTLMRKGLSAKLFLASPTPYLLVLERLD